jgi:antirestriction protein ArdC
MATKPRSADASGTEPATRTDLYSRITAKIVADLEQGMRPWHRPWNAGHLERRVIRPLRHNGIPYQGINTIMLWMAAVIAGYQSPHWFTFRQARELGGNVRKGEHGELVVYADRIIRAAAADRATHPCCRPVLFRDRSRDPSRRQSRLLGPDPTFVSSDAK